MKFIYAHESGISAHESMLIVAGVVIDADLQWRLVEQRVNGLINEYVPAEAREGFHFAEKRGAFLLRIADAGALILRYAFEEKAPAQPFVALMLGDNWQKPRINDEQFGGLGVLPFRVADSK